MKVLREVAKMMGNGGEEMIAGRSDFPNMRFDSSMLDGVIDMTQLPQMYKALDDEVNLVEKFRT